MHRCTVHILLVSFALSAADKPKDKFSDPLKPFVENLKGRGALPDGSKPLPPVETVKNFKLAEGLAMQVVAHEPPVAQPLNIYFDERGRLWVVQYLQYPFPAGLKIVEYDKYLRAIFDKVSPPPPKPNLKGTRKTTRALSEASPPKRDSPPTSRPPSMRRGRFQSRARASAPTTASLSDAETLRVPLSARKDPKAERWGSKPPSPASADAPLVRRARRAPARVDAG